MRLAIIILSYNTARLTTQCLGSLRKIQDLKMAEDFEVIVVDNHSQDQSVAIIEQNFPEVRLYKSQTNLGFSKGNNLGVQHLRDEIEYVLFLNSDTIVPTGTLSAMLRLMDESRQIGLGTCKVMLWNGRFDWDCHRGFPFPWAALTRLLGLSRLFPRSRIFNQYNQGWKDMNTTHEIDSAVGAFMLVRRRIGDQIGWWDEDYFLNGEDLDFCYRIKQAGYTVMYHPIVTIIHYRGASKGTRKESAQIGQVSLAKKKKVTQAGLDAMQLFYNKHLRVKYPWWMNKFVDIGLWCLRQKRSFSVNK